MNNLNYTFSQKLIETYMMSNQLPFFLSFFVKNKITSFHSSKKKKVY